MKQTLKILLPVTIQLSALGLVAPINANAQKVDTLERIEVISTATRTEQPVEGVTASVIVINQEEIEQTGAQSLKDIFESTPGLILQYGTFPSASSASKSSVSIRGVGATGSLWLLDGRRLSGEVKNPYDMDRIPASMIERIEIVKGPMSALYGADAVGGVINIITKKATEGVESNLSVRTGTNTDGDAGQTHFNGDLRGANGKLRYSFYASVQATDPYTEQESTQTRVGGNRHRPSIIPSAPGYLRLNGPTKGNPFYLQANGKVAPKPLNPSKLAGDKGAALEDFKRFGAGVNKIQDSYDVDVSYREQSDVNTIGGRLEFDATDNLVAGLDFNWFDEEREGVYRGVFHPMGHLPPVGHRTNPIVGHDTNGKPISFFQKFKKLKGKIPSWDVPVRSLDENERRDLSADAVLNVNEDLNLNFRLYNSYYEKRNTTTLLNHQDFGFPSEDKSAANGLSANVDITSFETYATWFASDAHLITSGFELRDEEREATVFSQGPGFDTRSVSYKALYAQDEWDFSDSVNITIGARFDEYTQDSYIDSLGQSRDDNSESETTFRIGALKNVSDMVNIRANFSQGFRVPDIRELFIQKQTPAGLQLGAQAVHPGFNKTAFDLKPEATDSYELGISGRNARMNYEIVAFFNEISNRIQQVSVDGDGDTRDDYFTFKNLSSAETSGLEATIGYRLTDALDVGVFWTELDTENKETGKELEFNPERAISVRLDWQASPKLHLGSDVTHTGEQFYIHNRNDKTADAYTLVGVNGSYRLGETERVEVFGGVDNLFDEGVDKRLGSNVGTFIFAGIRAKF